MIFTCVCRLSPYLASISIDSYEKIEASQTRGITVYEPLGLHQQV